jgi:hypothetical protein
LTNFEFELLRQLKEKTAVELVFFASEYNTKMVAKLQEEGFEGTPESIKDLLSYLLKIIGSRMTLEFIFSSHIAIWEEYRKMITKEMWLDISEEGNFNYENALILATSLIHREEIELGKLFLNQAIKLSDTVKAYTEVAHAIHSHLKDNEFAEEVLIMAKDISSSVDDDINIARALITIVDDKTAAKALFEDTISKIVVSHEYMELAAAVITSLNDCDWAKEIFEKRTSVPESGTPIEMLAEENYHDKVKEFCK